MLNVRVAGEDDRAEIARLWGRALAGLAGLRGGSTLAASLGDRYPSGDISSLFLPGRVVVLGCLDDIPVGFSYAELSEMGEERILNLEAIFVEPEARRVGMADVMLECLLAETSSWGATSVDAPALPGDRATKSLFESHGFRARLLVMRRDLDRPGPD